MQQRQVQEKVGVDVNYPNEIALMVVQADTGKFAVQAFTGDLDVVKESFDNCWKINEKQGKEGRAVFLRLKFNDSNEIVGIEHGTKILTLMGLKPRDLGQSQIRLGQGVIELKKDEKSP